jgi:eukaryotic-like serine/threonine-protein kinase
MRGMVRAVDSPCCVSPLAMPRLETGVVLADTYRVLRLLGEGGMAEVYEAEHMRFTAHFAVKVLLDEVAKREDVLKRFQREAEITSALHHPNIVHVVDFNRLADGTPYLVMEFLGGVDLAARLQEKGALPLAEIVEIVGQLASALCAAHSQKIVHRDLKPQNLFLVRLPGDDREVVKILDFGISKVREATTRLTRQASIIGTPQYMAPEQARGLIDQIDERTDQFSLAAITYELVTGQPPFRGEAIDAILYQVVHEPPPPFAHPMPAVEQVVLRGMAKNKAERFAGVREFHQALAEAVKHDGQRPVPSVPSTLLTSPDAPPETEVMVPREPTAILPGSTTLGSAAQARAGDGQATEPGTRRFPRAAMLSVLLLAGAGIATALLWPRRGEESKPSTETASVAPSPPPAPAVVVRKDASPPDLGPDLSAPSPLAAPESAAKPALPAKVEAKPPGKRKRKSQIRMEDL